MDRRKPMGQEGKAQDGTGKRVKRHWLRAIPDAKYSITRQKRRRPASEREREFPLLHPMYRGDNRGFAVLNRNTRTHDIETLPIS